MNTPEGSENRGLANLWERLGTVGLDEYGLAPALVYEKSCKLHGANAAFPHHATFFQAKRQGKPLISMTKIFFLTWHAACGP